MTPALKSVGEKTLLYVMAADAEYGPHLKTRIVPLITGVGPVEAAISVTHALSTLEAAGALPGLVVCLGSAGSRTLAQTEIYQVASASYRDMDASLFGFEKGVTPFLDLPAIVPMGLAVPGIETASISTGAAVIGGTGYEATGADMVDMETFAVLRCCQRFGVPMIGLRGISDGASDVSHIGDWTEYLHVVDEKLAAAVDRLEQAVLDGLL